MPDDFKPGERVICIGLKVRCNCPGGGKRLDNIPAIAPTVGETYTVVRGGIGHCIVCGYIASTFVPKEKNLHGMTWPQMCFRRIPPMTNEDVRQTVEKLGCGVLEGV